MVYQGFHLRGRFVECCLMCVYMRSQINRDAVINDGKLLLISIWGLRRGFVAASLLGLRVRIPPRSWMSFLWLLCLVRYSGICSTTYRSSTECGLSRVFRKKFWDIHLCHEICRMSKVWTLESLDCW